MSICSFRTSLKFRLLLLLRGVLAPLTIPTLSNTPLSSPSPRTPSNSSPRPPTPPPRTNSPPSIRSTPPARTNSPPSISHTNSTLPITRTLINNPPARTTLINNPPARTTLINNPPARTTLINNPPARTLLTLDIRPLTRSTSLVITSMPRRVVTLRSLRISRLRRR